MSRPHGSQKTLEDRRRRALVLFRRGVSAIETARRIGCARSAVYAWWQEGLRPKPVPGRPRQDWE